jgi:hypothetical protein
MASAMCFFSLFNAWVIDEGETNKAPILTRKAMIDAFLYSTLAGILVTILYA